MEEIVFGMDRINGEHAVHADLRAVNPQHTSGGAEYQENCGNCIAAYELRRRGFDVVASPLLRMPVKDWAGLFERFEPMKPTGGNYADAVMELTSEILKWGIGARGTIYGAWEKGGGHFFSFEVVDGGKVMFVDSQNANDDVAGYFKRLKPDSIIYGRLDNLKPGDGVKKAVRNRRRPDDVQRSV